MATRFDGRTIDDQEKRRLDRLDREIYAELQTWRREMRSRFWDLILDSRWVQARWNEMQYEEND